MNRYPEHEKRALVSIQLNTTMAHGFLDHEVSSFVHPINSFDVTVDFLWVVHQNSNFFYLVIHKRLHLFNLYLMWTGGILLHQTILFVEIGYITNSKSWNIQKCLLFLFVLLDDCES